MKSDGWRVRVTHETRFDYDGLARASYNEVRVTPRTERRQTALESKVFTTPSASQYAYVDYWGTQVIVFNVDMSHDVLMITGDSVVETQRAEEPDDCSWDDVADASTTMADFLSHGLYTEPGPELAEIANGLRGDRPLKTVHRILDFCQGALQYERGVTHVHTSANEAYRDGVGVCQDFAHLALALTKTVGIPCRYASGYFHPQEVAAIGEDVVGESHAWIEVWTGRWWGYDPTNDRPVGEQHIAVGRGRDYADVPPVKGVYAGSADHNMSVTVRMTRTS